MSNDTLSNKFHQNIIITAQHAGKRVDATINEMFEEFSRSQIQKWIKEGSIKVNGNTTKNKYILIGDETIDIDVEIVSATEWMAEDIDINIKYEDDDIIVIDKDANMVVHPGAGNLNGTISNALLHHNPEQDKIPRAGIVHRLDKDTTGLMVVAKTMTAYHKLVKQLADRDVNRRYLAIVEGEIHESGIIDSPIGRDPKNRTKMAINHSGKSAITEYRPIQVYDGFTLVECKLQTGRTHQIRVHMQSIKHPLVGDQTYNKGSKKLDKVDIEPFERQALHAYRLSFMHPTLEKEMNFKSKTPEDFRNLRVALEATTEYFDDYDDYDDYEDGMENYYCE